MNLKNIRPEAPRSELMELFDELANKRRVIYVHAPAGYGKTYSVRMWLSQRRITNAWISFGDIRDKSQGYFYEFGSRNLLKMQPDNLDLKEVVEHPAFNTASYEFSFNAIKALRNDGIKYAFVIDDLHLIAHNNKRVNIILEFIELLPNNFFVFILSRSAPTDHFSEFIMKDAMAVVDTDSLKFRRDEICSFFKACGHELSKTEADKVYERTDGWAIGLNALILSDSTAMNKRFAEKHFNTFLRDKVWLLWDEHLRDFMMKASVVPELTPECAAVLTGVSDSKKLLEELLWDNAFIGIDGVGVYRFHDLFRDFLLLMMENQGEQAINEQYSKAADWFFMEMDYYRAVDYYAKCKNNEGISKAIASMCDYNSKYASIEDTMVIIRQYIDILNVKQYPFLIALRPGVAFLEGDAKNFEKYMDEYPEISSELVTKNTQLATTIIGSHIIDYRKSLIHFTKSHNMLPKYGKISTPTFSLNMPFFHRSRRDFSEYAFNTEENIMLFEKTYGKLIGAEFSVVKNCICAGIYYEKGNLNEAYRFALLANTDLNNDFSLEIRFCAKMILANVFMAQGQMSDGVEIIESTAKMIEEKKAYYLSANFDAYKFRLKLMNGDEVAACGWLKKNPPTEQIPFYTLYRSVTTARALICIGEYNKAMRLLYKILSLVEAYKRPIDIIETKILLSVACWKKGKINQKVAIEVLESALTTAQHYGYTQVFINESAELINMLKKIQSRIQQNNGILTGKFVKTLSYTITNESKHFKGLTGGKLPQNLKFTKQQLTVMRHLYDGNNHREIGEIMGITYYGVREHLKRIYGKLDVTVSSEALMKIKELGIFDE